MRAVSFNPVKLIRLPGPDLALSNSRAKALKSSETDSVHFGRADKKADSIIRHIENNLDYIRKWSFTINPQFGDSEFNFEFHPNGETFSLVETYRPKTTAKKFVLRASPPREGMKDGEIALTPKQATQLWILLSERYEEYVYRNFHFKPQTEALNVLTLVIDDLFTRGDKAMGTGIKMPNGKVERVFKLHDNSKINPYPFAIQVRQFEHPATGKMTYFMKLIQPGCPGQDYQLEGLDIDAAKLLNCVVTWNQLQLLNRKLKESGTDEIPFDLMEKGITHSIIDDLPEKLKQFKEMREQLDALRVKNNYDMR